MRVRARVSPPTGGQSAVCFRLIIRPPESNAQRIFAQTEERIRARVWPPTGGMEAHIGFLGISEPIFYGDLVYKFKRIVGKPNFSDQFKKIVKRYIRVGYNLDIMRQSVCLVLNPITVYSYGFLFNCTTVGQASDSMTALT